MVMRARVATVVLPLLWATSAAAQPTGAPGASNYVVTFKKIADDCKHVRTKLGTAQVTFRKRPKRGASVWVDKLRLDGKVNARRFSMVKRTPGRAARVSGSFRGRKIRMLMIVEYYRGKRPLCTQTWNGKGARGVIKRGRGH